MVRTVKYIMILLISLLGLCTLFYSIALFVNFSKTALSVAKNISFAVCGAVVLVLVISVIADRFVPRPNRPVFTELEDKVLDTFTLILFFVYTICFGIKSEILDYWPRGSEMYTNAMIPGLLPLFSRFAVYCANHLINYHG